MNMYKYQDFIDKTEHCPPQTCTPAEGSAYRFVFESMEESSFIPVIVKTPSRIFKNDTEKCSAFALSMYETELQATKAFDSLQRRFKNIKQSIGSHIAKAVLTSSMGNKTTSNHQGHFDLYEFRDTSLPTHFEIVGTLP